ncbi:MAG: polyribonucleotide nucleotidyltransferase [Fusobacteriaceae bacterium]|nr:polyribonucleotide nucleotidyltransferase [Fusobacteriaceae bacterium]MBP6467510.1 polyribonucleotide nucleotidyltransferase [Fusobacteriaceae bacterium]MBP9595905.1 polyribonucleotide nucleotidyltransferase [Fusobacteriaceae bacterium]MBU9917968.1 polyribonucleotide nucleotidyltransferase [Fusobacteriaceae bacterium]
MFNEKEISMDLGGRPLKISTGKIARQAGGSVILEYGETVLLVTATRSKNPKVGIDFFPLMVDYIEKFYAVGKMPGGFIKRESRPSVEATLIGRLVDRPLRPLFPEGFYNDTHVVITTLSYDGINLPETIAATGASLALSISDIPFNGPVAGVIVGYVNGEYILNPSKEVLENCDIFLSIAGTKDAITMVEAGAKEVSEEVMLGAIIFGHDRIKEICAFQEAFIELVGNKEKFAFEVKEPLAQVKEFVDAAEERIKEAVLTVGKQAREEALELIEEKLLEEFTVKALEGTEAEELDKELLKEFKKYFEVVLTKVVRGSILYNKHRVDGRTTKEIRPLDVEIDILPRTHGSALFTRGETQALVIATLGTKDDEQIVDGLDEEIKKKFYLHYNFPAYSVGEAGFMRAPGRRELGHGSLAERALRYVMPSEEEFPYTVRLVSEITESNGSSSQASICGGSLALMAAGVPVKAPVAGIAMGLIKEGDDFVVLTDIMGIEDHLGDMDFKVAGTKVGITALQMDIKISGISREVMDIALNQALEARLEILEKMNSVIAEPKSEISSYAPRIHTLTIPTDKIATLIGPAGKNIKAIIEATGAKIDIEDTGKVAIFTNDGDMLKETVKLIDALIKDVEIGQVYLGKVTKVMKFGAFMEVLPGKEGLLHVSEIDVKRVENVEAVLKEGDEFEVKVISIEKGKVNLSRKILLVAENN